MGTLHKERCLNTLLVYPHTLLLAQVRDARLDALEADNYVEETGEGQDDGAFVESEVRRVTKNDCKKGAG